MTKHRSSQGTRPATVTPLVRYEPDGLGLALALADASGEAMMLVDKGGIVLHANPASVTLFATDNSDLRGRELRVLVPGCPGELQTEGEVQTWSTRVLIASEGVIELDISLRQLDPPGQSLLCLVAARVDTEAVQATQRKDAERWALAAQGSTDGFWHRPDVGLDSSWWSPRLYELLGLDPAETTPCFSALASRLHPDDRDEFLDHRARSLLTSKSFDAEVRLRHKNGEYRYFRVRALVTRERDGRPLALSGSVQDVSARMHMEHARRESEERYRTIVETAHDAVLVIDARDYRITDANGAASRLYGLDEDGVLGTRQPDLTANPEQAQRFLDQVRRTGTAPLYTDLHLRREGTLFPVEVSARQVNLAGRPSIVCMVRDVSERQRTLSALASSERRFRDFAELAADYFWETDRNLMLTFVSERCQVVNGIAPEAIIGRHVLEVFDNRFEDDEQQLRYRADLEGERPTQVEVTRVRPDESEIRVSISAKPIFDEQGQFAGLRGITRDITEAHELSARLAFQASHDALTGLVNRAEFERRLDRLLESARRDGSSHALCYLDLDQFKVVNDTCGHMAGDALLERLAETLTFRVRQRDTVARLGGDEFGVLIEHCSVEQATRVASVLHQAISEFVFTWDDRQFQVGASVGLVPITPDLGDATDLLGAADSACYLAKDQGRNRIHVYAKDDAEISRRRGEMNWVSHISGALSEGRFRLRSQTVLPLSPRHAGAHHCELLVVMLDRDGSEIQPGTFLPAAERYNLANRIDRWVIQAALKWLSSDNDARGRPALTGINLSAQSLGEADFLEFVRGECKRYGVPASRLCFEITETAAIANLDMARRLMDALRADGARFALDDFGKGLSSFGYLRSLPVDYIKIDAQFVRDMTTDPIDLAMVRSINEVASLMRKYTIAEGVESHEVLQLLREVGVDYAQGYAIGRPRFI